MSEFALPYIESGPVPEIFATELHDIQIIGSVWRFVLATRRKSPEGLLHKAPVADVLLPFEAVGPAVSLTWSKLASGVIVPAVASAAKRLLTH